MVNHFESAKYLTVWAKQQIDDFEGQVVTYVDSKPQGIFTEEDAETGEVVIKVCIAKPLPINLPGLAFNIATCLRSSLDQMMFEIAGTGKEVPFPFGKTEGNLEDGIKGRIRNKVPQEIVDLVRRFKPYKGGNDLLYALNCMANSNKHAVVAPMVSGIAAVEFRNVEDSVGMRRSPLLWDGEKNEMELMRFTNPYANREFQANVGCYILVAVQNIDGMLNKPAATVFRDTLSIVERILMTFEAECVRIGRF